MNTKQKKIKLTQSYRIGWNIFELKSTCWGLRMVENMDGYLKIICLNLRLLKSNQKCRF